MRAKRPPNRRSSIAISPTAPNRIRAGDQNAAANASQRRKRISAERKRCASGALPPVSWLPPTLVFNQDHAIGDVLARRFHIVHAHFLVFRQCGSVERFTVRIDIHDALAELELRRLVWRKRIKHQDAAWRVLFNRTGAFRASFRIWTATGWLSAGQRTTHDRC